MAEEYEVSLPNKPIAEYRLVGLSRTRYNDLLRKESDLNDWLDYYGNVINERVHSDEQHCTCVPALRKEIDRLQKLLRIAKHGLKVIKRGQHDPQSFSDGEWAMNIAEITLNDIKGAKDG